eukprot:scaffold149824_cov30-Cyclotella_meneghiniana.AAC.1
MYSLQMLWDVGCDAANRIGSCFVMVLKIRWRRRHASWNDWLKLQGLWFRGLNYNYASYDTNKRRAKTLFWRLIE